MVACSDRDVRNPDAPLLHCGFSFGLNVHTLTYVFMVLTIATGVWGIIMYHSLPTKLYSQRGGGSIKERLAAIYELNENCLWHIHLMITIMI